MGNLLTKLCADDIDDEQHQVKNHVKLNSNLHQGHEENPSSILNQPSLKSSDHNALNITPTDSVLLLEQHQQQEQSSIVLLDSKSLSARNQQESVVNNNNTQDHRPLEFPLTNLTNSHDIPTVADPTIATTSDLTTGTHSKDQSGNSTVKGQMSGNNTSLRAPGTSFFKQISSSFTSLNGKSSNHLPSDSLESKEHQPSIPALPAANIEHQPTTVSSSSKKVSKFPGIRKTISSLWSQKKKEKNGKSAEQQQPHPKSLSLQEGLLGEDGFEFSAEDRKLLLANEIPASEIEKLSIGVDAGGMGVIHMAEWKGIKVAIKEAQAQVISKEVEIYTRMLGYEGVVRFYGVTYPPGLDKLCIVTKYAENGSLSWHLKAGFNKLTWANKLSLATQIASSVAQLHEKGIFHRDLHGGNILIDEAGNALLTDFGASTMEERLGWAVNEFAITTLTTPEGTSKFISERFPNITKDLEESGASKSNPVDYSNNDIKEITSIVRSKWGAAAAVRTAADSSSPENDQHDSENEDQAYEPLIGVMAYIAPERFRNPRYFDARCDIYSLGVLLWDLTSGYGAFAKLPQDVGLAFSILNGKREGPVEGTPEKYRRLYEQCWDMNPDERPSLAEILSTLAEVRAELSEEQLAATRERNTYDDEGSDFEDSVSVPRPTSDYQKYLLPEETE